MGEEARETNTDPATLVNPTGAGQEGSGIVQFIADQALGVISSVTLIGALSGAYWYTKNRIIELSINQSSTDSYCYSHDDLRQDEKGKLFYSNCKLTMIISPSDRFDVQEAQLVISDQEGDYREVETIAPNAPHNVRDHFNEDDKKSENRLRDLGTNKQIVVAGAASRWNTAFPNASGSTYKAFVVLEFHRFVLCLPLKLAWMRDPNQSLFVGSPTIIKKDGNNIDPKEIARKADKSVSRKKGFYRSFVCILDLSFLPWVSSVYAFQLKKS